MRGQWSNDYGKQQMSTPPPPSPPGHYRYPAPPPVRTSLLIQILALTWVDVSKALEALDGARVGERSAKHALVDARRQASHSTDRPLPYQHSSKETAEQLFIYLKR